MTNEQIAKSMEFDYFTDGGGRLFIEGVNNGRAVDFLNDHNAAMMVVEKMREDEYVYEVDEAPASRDYHVMFYNIDEHLIGEIDATNKSLCHAICEAALKAKGG